MPNDLGQKLKKYREEVFPDMGLRRVADKIGVDYSYLYRIEDGKYSPSDDMLAKITASYNLDNMQKLELFNLVHSTVYQGLIHDVYKQDAKAFGQAFAFNRKKKNK